MKLEKTYVLLRDEQFQSYIHEYLDSLEFVSNIVIDDIDVCFDFDGTTQELMQLETTLDTIWMQFQQVHNGFTFQ